MPVEGPRPAARTLAPATRALLRERLAGAGGEGIAAFAAQVTLQVAHPLGAAASAERERAVAARVAGALAAACAAADAGARERAAGMLAADVAILSACFQNLDLLPPGDPAGDAIALLVMDALARLDAA